MKLNNQQLEATVRLMNTEDFKIFLSALGDYGEKQMKNLVYADNASIHKKQGFAQALTAIVEAIHKAPDTLNQIQTRGEHQQ